MGSGRRTKPVPNKRARQERCTILGKEANDYVDDLLRYCRHRRWRTVALRTGPDERGDFEFAPAFFVVYVPAGGPGAPAGNQV